MPEHYQVANAYGAAIAEIPGTVDTVVSLTNRQKVLDELRNLAMQLAVENGADPRHATICQQEIIPFPYVPNNIARVIITARGKRLRQRDDTHRNHIA